MGYRFAESGAIRDPNEVVSDAYKRFLYSRLLDFSHVILLYLSEPHVKQSPLFDNCCKMVMLSEQNINLLQSSW